MKLYFNPNAAPQTLYPIIPLLLALENEVVIWDPNPAHIETYLNGDLWLGILSSPEEVSRLKFLHSTWGRQSLELTADRSIVARSILKRLTPDLERTPEMKASIQSLSRSAWKSLSDPEREALSHEMLSLRRDLEAKNPEVLHRLTSNFSLSREFPESCALFDSVVQDIVMLWASGASTPLSEPSRWSAYSAALNGLAGSFAEPNAGRGPVADADEAIRVILDSTRPLTGKQSLDVEKIALAARLIHCVERMNDLTFREFQDRRVEFKDTTVKFAAGLEALAESPLLRQPGIVARLAELNELIRARRERNERAGSLVLTTLGAGGALGSGVRELVIAGLGVAGALLTNPLGLGEALARIGLPKALVSRPMRIVLQRPDVWVDLLGVDRSRPTARPKE